MYLVFVTGEKITEQIWRTNHLCEISSDDSTFCHFKVSPDMKRSTNLNVKYEDVFVCDNNNDFALTSSSVRLNWGWVVWSLSRQFPAFSLINRTINFS
jgi:hypothetical protein